MRLIGTRWWLLGLAAIVLFAAWSRVPFVREGLWQDEAVVVAVASAPSSGELFARLGYLDSHPPLLYGLTALCGHLFGFGQTSLKILALGIGLAAIALVAWLAAEGFGFRAAVPAALLATHQALLLRMSGELRSYSLSAALGALALTLTLRTLRTGERMRIAGVIGLAAAFTLLAYSNYAGTLVVGIVGIYALWRIRPGADPSGWKAVALAATCAGLLFLPWLPATLRHARIGLPWDPPLSLAQRAAAFPGKVEAVLPAVAPLGVAFVFELLGAIFVAVAAVFAWSRIRVVWGERRLAFGLVGGCALAVLFVMGMAAGQPRYLTLVAGLVAVFLSGLICSVWDGARARGRVSLLAVSGVALLLVGDTLARLPLYVEMQSWGRPEPKSGVKTLCASGRLRPDEVVFVVPDCLATSVWYFCQPSPPILRGYMQWDDPFLPNWERYPELTRPPIAESVAAFIARVEQTQRHRAGERFSLVWGDWPDPPLFYGRRVELVRRALRSRFIEGPTSIYRGRHEYVQVTDYTVRSPSTLPD